MSVKQLIVRERILLHLFDYSRFADEYEAPLDVTQKGIAEATGIRVHHVGQYIKPLVAEEFVIEKTSHVKKRPRRAKVYFLTARGRHKAASLRNAVLKGNVPIRSASGDLVEVSLSQIYHEDRRGSSLLELLEELRAAGHIVALAPPEVAAAVDFSQEAPEVESFYGRDEELEQLAEAVEKRTLVVVIGVGGIGKTSLAAKLCEGLRGSRPLFWRRVRPWDLASDLALSVASFLRSLGRDRLHRYLATTGYQEASRIEEILTLDARGMGGLIVFDDVHEAREDAQAFLSMLFHALRDQDGGCLLLLTRVVPAFYSRQHVVAEQSVGEVFLKGLDPQSSVAFLSDSGVSAPLAAGVVKISGGHPLFLKILVSLAPSEGIAAGSYTLDTYLTEEVEPSLTQEERECLSLASFYQIPVPAEALLIGDTGTRSTVVTLQKKGILEHAVSDRVAIHDFLRDHFSRGLGESQRQALAERASRWLSKTAERASYNGDTREAVALLKNAVATEFESERRVTLLERLAELRQLSGDRSGALETYRMALAEASDPLLKARLHAGASVSCENMMLYEESLREIERGLMGLPDAASREAADLRLMRAWVHMFAHRFETCREDLEAIEGWLGSLNDPLLWFRFFRLRGRLYWGEPSRKNLELAEADLRRSLEHSKAIDNAAIRAEARAVINDDLARIAFQTGRPKEGLALLDEAIEISRRTGSEGWLSMHLVMKGKILSECLGEHDSAERLYLEAYAGDRQVDPGGPFGVFQVSFAQLFWRMGRYQEAKESMEYFLAHWSRYSLIEEEILAVASMVRYCAACEDLDSAEMYLERMKSLSESASSKPADYFLLWARGIVSAHGDYIGEAEHHLQRAHELKLSGGDFLTDAIGFLHLGGPQDEFALDYANVLAARGKVERAKHILAEALDDFQDRGRKPLAEEAEKALHVLESRRRRKRP